jgi:hypothetical protein
MQKDVCERCKEYRYINKHHIYPRKFFGKTDNEDVVKLCLLCHAEIHELLPVEKQEKSFYKNFTLKFLGLISLLFFIFFLLNKQ